jgi:hypothetical protein
MCVLLDLRDLSALCSCLRGRLGDSGVIASIKQEKQIWFEGDDPSNAICFSCLMLASILSLRVCQQRTWCIIRITACQQGYNQLGQGRRSCVLPTLKAMLSWRNSSAFLPALHCPGEEALHFHNIFMLCRWAVCNIFLLTFAPENAVRTCLS